MSLRGLLYLDGQLEASTKMYQNIFQEILKTESLVTILKKVPLALPLQPRRQLPLQRIDICPLAFLSLLVSQLWAPIMRYTKLLKLLNWVFLSNFKMADADKLRRTNANMFSFNLLKTGKKYFQPFCSRHHPVKVWNNWEEFDEIS